ncbi:MAG: ABC transporter substrate-binding protein [Bauldia sp.]|nr:ABC transporter substrate-binding protein [Bauldia sp.]
MPGYVAPTLTIARRRFLAGAGALAVMPGRVIAQPARQRRVGIMLGSHAGDPVVQSFATAIVEGLAAEGWTDLDVTTRFNEANPALSAQFAAEFVAAAVDVIVAAAPPNAIAAARATSVIPIVFFAVGDPISDGLVQSFARPGGNATGFTKEGQLGGKYLDLLRGVYPGLTRAVMIYNPDIVSTEERIEQTFIEAGAALGIEAYPAQVHNLADVDAAFDDLTTRPGGGAIMASDNFTFSYRSEILELVDRYRIPAMHPQLESVTEGGLISYSVDRVAIARSAGVLAGRILDGARPQDFPVESPSRFLLAINISAAARLGLTFPLEMLATADIVVD